MQNAKKGSQEREMDCKTNPLKKQRLLDGGNSPSLAGESESPEKPVKFPKCKEYGLKVEQQVLCGVSQNHYWFEVISPTLVEQALAQAENNSKYEGKKELIEKLEGWLKSQLEA